jgi:hypothetical protein
MFDYNTFTGSSTLERAMQIGLELAEVSIKTGEMAVAANTVIAERVALMVEAARDPLAGDYAEFARMLHEKVAAMQEAGVALLDRWWALQRNGCDYTTCAARSLASGWGQSPGDIAELAERASSHGAWIAVAAIDAASVALAPFHECATSNARRLSHPEQC